MRRSILIAVLAGSLVGLAVAAGISLAGNGGSSSSGSGKQASSASTQGSFQSAYAKRGNQRKGQGRRGGRRGGNGHGGAMRFGAMAMIFKGLADKLGVEQDELRDAIRGVKKRALDRAVSDGTISQAERAALDACMKSRGGSGCDRKAAKAAHRKLQRAIKARAKSDAAGLKKQVIDDLAAELGKQPEDVDTAARAQLKTALDTGVTMGFITEKGRELALGCWDSPNQCDRKALRAEVKKRFRGRSRGHHGGRRGP